MSSKTSTCALLLGIALATGASAQRITGKVIDNEGSPIAYASVVLRSIADSSLIDGTLSGDDGSFTFGTERGLPLIIEISYMGYSTWAQTVSSLPLAPITLSPAPQLIDGVVVLAPKQKVVETRHGVLTVDVSRTFLKNETDIYTLLAKVPGLMVKDGGIALFGKQRLDVYVDGRKALSDEEYATLQPSDLVRVEVVRNPGTEYDASCDAVLRIYTNRTSFARTTRLALTNGTSISRGFENNARLSANHSLGVIAQTLNYRHGYSTGLWQHDINHTYNHQPQSITHSLREVTKESGGGRHGLFYGLSLRPSSSATLGVQYVAYRRSGAQSSAGTLDIFDNETPTFSEHLREDVNSDDQLHNIGINARWNMPLGIALTFVGDYAYARNGALSNVEEQPVAGAIRMNGSSTTRLYHIFSANPQLTYSGRKITLTAGAKTAYMRNRYTLQLTGSNHTDSVRLSDFVGAAYAQLEIKTAPVNITLGLRGEWATAEQRSNTQAPAGKQHSDILPYISLERRIADAVDVSLSYRKSVNRPRIDQLDPTYTYRDTLTYLTGNPNLKPETTDMFDLSVGYGSLGFEAGYQIYRNAYIILDEQDATNPNVLRSTYGNMERANTVIHLGLNHSYSYKILNTMLSAMVDKPRAEIPFLDGVALRSKPRWYLQAQANVEPLKWLSLSAAFSYVSQGDIGDTRYRESSSLDFEVRLRLLRESLLITLGVDDVLRTKYNNSWMTERNRVRYTMHTTPNSPEFTFTISYKLGGKVKPVQAESSSEEARNRL